MRKVRTGIIGTGKVSHLHAAALANNPRSEFVAAFARSPEKAESFAKKYGVNAYSDLDRFFAESGVEAVTICTPHPAHKESVIAAAAAGVHVFIEKPLASSLEDCDAMLAAASKTGIKLGMVSQRRYFEPCTRIHKAISEGKIGRPILGSVTMLGWRDDEYYNSDPWRGKWREEGGGVLVNQAVHQLDLLLWYMGPVAELSGYWANLNHPKIEVEDCAVASIRFQSGALGQIFVSNSYQPALFGKVHVLGSNGSAIGVQTDGGAMFVAGVSKIEEPPFNDIWTIPGEAHLLKSFKAADSKTFQEIDATSHYHALQIDDFLKAILEDRNPSVSGEEGRAAVELFTALYRSERDRTSIKFPLQPESDRTDFDGRIPTQS